MRISKRNAVLLIEASFLILVVLSLFLTTAQGESRALLSVDTLNEEKLIEKGNTVFHNITVTNDLGARTVVVNLSAEIYEVSPPGNASNWSVKFKYGGSHITSIEVDQDKTETVDVEVYAPISVVLHETANIRVSGKDGYQGTYPQNTTRCRQNGEYGTYLMLNTTVGQNYEPRVEIARGSEQKQEVNPLSPTTYKIKVRNYGLKTDSYRLSYNVSSPIRGESRATATWKVIFSPSAYIQDLESMDYTFIYVNVTSPSNAIYGDYRIAITAASQSSNSEDTVTILAVIPIPDLYANLDDIVFSRFPVIDGQEMAINITIHNKGGALKDDFAVNFWIEDTEKPGAYNIIGSIRVEAIMSYEAGFATVTFTPELSKRIKETLTTLLINIEIDAESEIIESDEDNNVVSNDIEVMRAVSQPPTPTITGPENGLTVEGTVKIKGTLGGNITRSILYYRQFGNNFMVRIGNIGPDVFSVCSVDYVLLDYEGNAVPGAQGSVKDIYGLNIDDKYTNLSFQDNDRDGKITPGDMILIKDVADGGPAQEGYSLLLKYSIVAQVEISINGGAWIPAKGTDNWTYDWDTTKLKNGEYTIRVRAVDGDACSEEVIREGKVENKEEDGGGGEFIPGFTASFYLLAIGVAVFVGVVKKQRKMKRNINLSR